MRPRLKEAERREPHRAATLMTDLDAAILILKKKRLDKTDKRNTLKHSLSYNKTLKMSV